MKKTAALILACVIAVTLLCGCRTHYSSTTTTTTTTTDADGNTVTETVTTYSNTDDGVTTEGTDTSKTVTYADPKNLAELAADGESHTIQMKLVNSSDLSVAVVYMVMPDTETWGDNLIEGIDDGVLNPGESISGSFTFGADSLVWDFRFKDPEGAYVDFENVDVSEVGVEGITVELINKDEGTYTLSVY